MLVLDLELTKKVSVLCCVLLLLLSEQCSVFVNALSVFTVASDCVVFVFFNVLQLRSGVDVNTLNKV